MTVRDLVPWGRRSQVAGPSGNAEHPFFSLQRDVNRVYDDLFKGFYIGFPMEYMGGSFAGSWPRLEV
jgi:HSP20 family protein